MKHRQILPAWGRILKGQRPLLSLEITRECPLRCPGCYAYEPEHLGDAGPLRQLSDFQGEKLVSGVLALVRRFRPMHLSIVGGEPLVRYRELETLLPKLGEMGIEVQLVTSAVRQIPTAWAKLSNVHLVVSIDGLAPEHDLRRAPATYERILKNIAGHQVIVHCTVTRQQTRRPGYLRRIRPLLVGSRRMPQNLVQPVHAAARPGKRRAPDSRRPLARGGGHRQAAGFFPEDANAGRDPGRIPASSVVAAGLHLRANYREYFGRPADAHRSVPVWRRPVVRGMRMRGLGRATPRLESSNWPGFFRCPASSSFREKSANVLGVPKRERLRYRV